MEGAVGRRAGWLLIALVLPVPAAAGPEAPLVQGVERTWKAADLDQGALNILIVPPAHGQLYQVDAEAGHVRLLDGQAPRELTPFNSYLDAMVHAVEDWRAALSQFGTEGPDGRRWIADLRFRVTVLGGSVPTPAEAAQLAARRWHVVITAEESLGPYLAVSAPGLVRSAPCVVGVVQWFQQSPSYADVYDLVGGAFGRCLGLDVLTDGRVHEDQLQRRYHHLGIGLGAASDHAHGPSNLNVKGLEVAFAGAFGRAAPPAQLAVGAYLRLHA